MILIFYFHYIYPSFHLKHTLILSFNYLMSNPSILGLNPSTLYFSSLNFKFFSPEPEFSFYFLYLIAWLYFCLLFIIMLNFVFSFQESLHFFFFSFHVYVDLCFDNQPELYRGEPLPLPRKWRALSSLALISQYVFSQNILKISTLSVSMLLLSPYRTPWIHQNRDAS